MSDFDAAAFGAWLEKHFQASFFKSYSELGNAVGVSRTTISALAKARPQSVSNRPSRPKRDLVIALAEALKADVNAALLLAGHAPIQDDDLVADGLFSGYYELNEEKRKFARKQIADLIKNLKEME